MSEATPARRLRALWGEICDLSAAEDLVSWDQETCMPPRGLEGRKNVLSTLAGHKHAALTAPQLRDVLAACEEAVEPDGLLAAEVREARRQSDRATRVPSALARALAEAQSVAQEAWKEARRQSDFTLFQPHLEGLVRLKREEAAAVAPDGSPYDALLDEHEAGATEAQLAPLFAALRDALSPLVKAVADSGQEVDESPVRGEFPAERQLAFGRLISERIGFDFEAGRIDTSTHPFCSGINPGDVRITWRWQEDDLRPGLFGILHEMGHGLYEQGLPEAWRRRPVGSYASLGMHESQSRLWENLVGRSRAFWLWALPHLREHLPGTADLTVERLWPALHTVKPSLIRVEADEGTYNLHIVARFEVERALFSGRLEVADLPAAWDEAYEELLGLRPPSTALGVLQDVHWSMGYFGYFPTYTLGNLIACQLFAAARRDLGDLDAAFAGGEFLPLLGWLREHIHRHGSRYTTAELVRRATGKPLSSDDFLAYITATTEEVYAVRV